jgi:hypothetical protein
VLRETSEVPDFGFVKRDALPRRLYSTLNAQRSTLNAQRSTLNAQRSTLNAQRSTLNMYLSFIPSSFHPFSGRCGVSPLGGGVSPNRQLHRRVGDQGEPLFGSPTTSNNLKVPLNPQPSTLNPQPSTLNPQPSTLNPLHAANTTQKPYTLYKVSSVASLGALH